MTRLVASSEEVIANVRRFNADIEQFVDLLSYNRAWYALKTDEGWMLAPSKFIGYAEMSADEYLGSPYDTAQHGRVGQGANALVLDGRVTEGVLGRWSALIEPGHPRYAELHTALNELCGRFGKKPNGLSRISIITDDSEDPMPEFDDELVNLLAAVFKKLTPAQKSVFRKLVA